MMTRKRTTILAGVTALAAAGLAAGVAVAATGPSGQQPAAASSAAPASPAGYSSPSYSWYRSMMSGYGGAGGGMMGSGSSSGSYGWMMSQAGYQWMTGGSGAPGWMTSGTLPPAMTAMMGGTDPGTVMGTLFANAPGPRISPAQAGSLGSQAPAGASINKAARTITFTTTTVHLAVLASPSMPAESFRIAGMTNPAIIVSAGAHITIELINADADMAHGLVIMPAGAARSYMPMMTAAPAFTGSALWFLGKTATAGMHEGAITFTATTPGSYQYLCPVPGHAQKGMTGTLTVR